MNDHLKPRTDGPTESVVTPAGLGSSSPQPWPSCRYRLKFERGQLPRDFDLPFEDGPWCYSRRGRGEKRPLDGTTVRVS